MKINIITIFPDFFKNSTNYSILKRAQDKGILEINIYNLRDWAEDNYQTIDERPFGGGAGMVMMLPPVYKALKAIGANSDVIVPSAKGQRWDQKKAYEFSKKDELTFIVPHFEGIDQRVIDNFVDYEISIGPYVLSGGEIPTISIIDSIVRLIDGVLGNPESLEEESFSIDNKDSLEYPQYTRPQKFTTDDGRDLNVPEVLLSGNHEEIRKWREENIKKSNIL